MKRLNWIKLSWILLVKINTIINLLKLKRKNGFHLIITQSDRSGFLNCRFGAHCSTYFPVQAVLQVFRPPSTDTIVLDGTGTNLWHIWKSFNRQLGKVHSELLKLLYTRGPGMLAGLCFILHYMLIGSCNFTMADRDTWKMSKTRIEIWASVFCVQGLF